MPGTKASPFLSTSIWNTSLGAANEANWIAGGFVSHDNLRPDECIIVLSETSPLVPVWTNDVAWTALAQSDEHARERTDAGAGVNGASAGYSLPWPNAFILPGGDFTGDTPNFPTAVLKADGVTIRNLQPTTHGSSTLFAPSSAATNTITVYDDNPPDDNIVTGDGRFGAQGGSGLSSLGGVIRIGELTAASTGGYIHHTLKIEGYAEEDYSTSSGSGGGPGYRWPADASDNPGPGGAVPSCLYGSLMALKQSFNVAALNTEPARIIARTLQIYGAYIVDSTSWNAYAICTERGPAGRVAGPADPGCTVDDEFLNEWGYDFSGATTVAGSFYADIKTIFLALYVVNNNYNGTSGTIGGPGTRLADLASSSNAEKVGIKENIVKLVSGATTKKIAEKIGIRENIVKLVTTLFIAAREITAINIEVDISAINQRRVTAIDIEADITAINQRQISAIDIEADISAINQRRLTSLAIEVDIRPLAIPNREIEGIYENIVVKLRGSQNEIVGIYENIVRVGGATVSTRVFTYIT